MKTSDLLRQWDNFRGQIEALSAVKCRVTKATSIPSLLEELTTQVAVLTDSTDRIEDELEPHLFKLLGEVGLVDMPPEMKMQWESFAGRKEVPDLIHVLTQLKESGLPVHQFLNRVRSPPADA